MAEMPGRPFQLGHGAIGGGKHESFEEERAKGGHRKGKRSSKRKSRRSGRRGGRRR